MPHGAPRLVMGGLQAGLLFTLSADARRLLYTRDAYSSHLWLVRVKTPGNEVEARQLTKGTVKDAMPSVSPDGTRVAFARDTGDARNIFVSDMEGGPATQLTFFQSHNDLPVWSRDGKEIAFAYEEGGVHRIGTIPANGGTARSFPGTDLGQRVMLSWTPSGEILFPNTKDKLELLDPVSGKTTPQPLDESLGEPIFPVLSPDGKRIALVTSHENETLVSIVSRDTGKAIKTWQDDSVPMGWAADGTGVFDRTSVEGRTSVVLRSLSGADKEILPTIPIDDHVGTGTPIPDGRGFVFVAGHLQSVVWLMENFDPDVD